MLGMLGTLWAAHAQPDTVDEIFVTEAAVQRARQAVIDELVDLGFSRVKEKDGRVVLKHETTWRGKVILYDDGYLRHRRQGFRVVEGPAVGLPKGTRWLPCILIPTGCVKSGATVSDRKFNAERDRTMSAVENDLRNLGDRMADAAVATNLMMLPDRFDALWERGTPLDGAGPPLATYQARRAALLRFWETRTETEWGESVREAVEAFAAGAVQPSDHPFPDWEIERFNATRRASRPFPRL